MESDPALQNHNADPAACYHCGEPVPVGIDILAIINGKAQRMCCYGCRAVAETINDYGLGKYYRFRSGPAVKPDADTLRRQQDFELYDRPDIQASFVKLLHANRREANLIIGDIVCPACTWLIETHLRALDGIETVNTNYSASKAVVCWDKDRISLSRILAHIHALGYKACPYETGRLQAMREKERKTFLLRIGVAGLLGMQVMMIAIGLYAGEWSGIDTDYRSFLQWISLLLTLPVMAFSALPFYKNTWRAIKNKRIGMDVPLACGISVAFLASVSATVTGTGAVYYDSVVMLVFFLLCGRYLEFMARNRAALHIDSIARVIPAMAHRLPRPGHQETECIVPVADLEVDDIILVKPGETVPVDGLILNGKSRLNESIITGEFMPVSKQTSDTVIAGSVNTESPLQVRVTATGDRTCLSRICSLVEEAQSQKPAMTLLADRIAGRFLFAVMLLAFATACFWLYTDSTMWIAATVAVLVISCPCALSLATPTAVTVATNRLLRRGIAVLQTDALETLGKITHIALDKTGTLTEGKLIIDDLQLFGRESRDSALSLAASLESPSGHPIAQAFSRLPVKRHTVTDVVNYPGEGISGCINNERFCIGSPTFIEQKSAAKPNSIAEHYSVLLANEHHLLAGFAFCDKPREQLRDVIESIKQAGITPLIVSGDNEKTVARVAQTAGVEVFHAGLSPEGKMMVIWQLQHNGARVAMLGDGVNDAPVMAAADVAIALDSGTDLSKITADVVLLGNNLPDLTALLQTARATRRKVGQNIGWAISYNLLAVPAAMAGLIAPWAAAIGMSASSLLVVVNSLRTGRKTA